MFYTIVYEKMKERRPMRELDEFKDKLRHARPEQWDLIPDIELYMDQVISYMTRQHIGLELDGR